MPIPVDYFQPLSFEQANPILAGIQAGQNIFSQGVQNAYAPQTLAAQLQHALLQNQNLGITNQYLPQDLQTQIALRQAQTGETGAQTGLINQQTQNAKNFPVQQGIAGQMAYLDYLGRTQGTNSPSYQMSKALLNAQMQEQLARAAYFGSNVQFKNLPNAVKDQMIAGGAPIGTMTTPNINLNNPQQGAGSPATVQNFGTNYNSPAIQDVAASGAIKGTVPGTIQNQRYYSQSFDNQIQPWLQKLPEISNYAGLAGKANLAADKYATAFGLQNSPQYQDWNSFVNAASDLAGNELRRSLGVNASVSEKQDLKNLMDPAYWNENPSNALSRFNAILAAKKANDQVIFQSQNQALQTGKANLANPVTQFATRPGTGAQIAKGQYQIVNNQGQNVSLSDADLIHTAQKYNMSVDQVKQRLGIR